MAGLTAALRGNGGYGCGGRRSGGCGGDGACGVGGSDEYEEAIIFNRKKVEQLF